MNASRQSDKVTWWQMGRAAAAKFGIEKATDMASTIRSDGIKALWMSGANGEPKPKVRPPLSGKPRISL